MVKQVKKPLFLHSRAAHDDFIDILKRHHDQLFGGVVIINITVKHLAFDSQKSVL
jgi:Tat protein secretion system quality control protein TatD with DNase activity